MKKARAFIIWLIVFVFGFSALSYILVPIWTEPLYTTATLDGFYAEPKDSLDVVILGSSQAAMGFSPMELYEEYGIRSYMISTGGQPSASTYYWLREMAKTQKPKVVVVETRMFLLDAEFTAEDGVVRQSIENMHLNGNKIAAAYHLHQDYPEFESTVFSYIFPIMQYHSRWKELTGEDLTYFFQDKEFYRKGYTGSAKVMDLHNETGFTYDPTYTKEAKFTDYQRDYLDRIIDFCAENEIELLLVKTPIAAYNQSSYNAIAHVAADADVPFLDFNEAEIRAASGFDPATDFEGLPHLNSHGATQVTAYLGKYLLAHYPALTEAIEGREESPAWEADLVRYREYIAPIRAEYERNCEKLYGSDN